MLYEVITIFEENYDRESEYLLSHQIQEKILKGTKISMRKSWLYNSGRHQIRCGRMLSNIVITSYSIHYTKLYDLGVDAISPSSFQLKWVCS